MVLHALVPRYGANAALLGSNACRISPVRVFVQGSVVFRVLDLALFYYPLFLSGAWIGIMLIGLVGIPTISMGAGFMTMLQQLVQDAYRGRVFGTCVMIATLLQPGGTLIAGTLGGMAGLIVLLTIQGGSYVLMGGLALVILPGLLSSGTSREGEPMTTAPAGDATLP